MKHAQRLTSWRKSMDILSYIPSMTLPLQQVREPLRWKSSKSFPLWIISSFPSARRTGNRRFHAGEAVKSEDQGDRRRACKCKLHAGIHQKRQGDYASFCQHDCRRHCSKTPGTKIFPYIQKNLDDIITVEDAELVGAFLDMVENHKLIVENSGLLTVAALKHLDLKGKKVVSILSGGNMDVITMSSVVQQGLILRDRIFTVSVLLPDKPATEQGSCRRCKRARQRYQAVPQPVCFH